MNNPFPDLTVILRGLFITCLIMLPLAMWKLFEILAWIIAHIKISLT